MLAAAHPHSPRGPLDLLPLPTDHDRLQARALLVWARALIEREASWKPGWLFAEDEAGAPVDPRAPDAVRFSAGAALRRVGPRVSGFTVLLALPFLDCAAGEPFDDWENAARRTHAEVIAAFDRAITLLDVSEEAEGITTGGPVSAALDLAPRG